MGVVTIPKVFRGLQQAARYKVFYGGRGAAKSESVGRYLLLSGTEKPLTILCAREYQSSIKQSVKQLLENLISELGLTSFYRVLTTEIEGQNGTRFIFAGLRHNINNIKSIPNISKCWVEEAQTVSDASWSVLIPTIRAEDSEIIITFNPELADDPTYKRFVLSPPKGAIVQKVSYRDNKYFPDVLERERVELFERDPIAYDHVWEGNPRAAVEGAVFAQQLSKAEQEGRITDVEYNPSIPVHTYWDLGKSDKTAIWFCQYAGMQWRVLHHYSNFLQPLEHYIDYVQAQAFTYGTHYLPHDARQDRLGMQRSIEDQARAALGNVEVVDRVARKAQSIEAAKAIFDICVFDSSKCSDGLNDLRKYRYALDAQSGRVSKAPLHDIHSDSADAFQCFAMAAQPDRVEDDRPRFVHSTPRLG